MSKLLVAVLLLGALLALPGVAKAQSIDPCLEKEIQTSTRIIEEENGKIKIGFLVEHITWSDEYRRAGTEVIQKEFSSRFIAAPDEQLGVLLLYITGTSASPAGGQFVDIKLEDVVASELLLPENPEDFHLAKLNDPTHLMKGKLVFAEEGAMIPPITQGLPFQIWHELMIDQVRQMVRKALSTFVEDWEKTEKKP
jgi:hypothetical protein